MTHAHAYDICICTRIWHMHMHMTYAYAHAYDIHMHMHMHMHMCASVRACGAPVAQRGLLHALQRAGRRVALGPEECAPLGRVRQVPVHGVRPGAVLDVRPHVPIVEDAADAGEGERLVRHAVDPTTRGIPQTVVSRLLVRVWVWVG